MKSKRTLVKPCCYCLCIQLSTCILCAIINTHITHFSTIIGVFPLEDPLEVFCLCWLVDALSEAPVEVSLWWWFIPALLAILLEHCCCGYCCGSCVRIPMRPCHGSWSLFLLCWYVVCHFLVHQPEGREHCMQLWGSCCVDT